MSATSQYNSYRPDLPAQFDGNDALDGGDGDDVLDGGPEVAYLVVTLARAFAPAAHESYFVRGTPIAANETVFRRCGLRPLAAWNFSAQEAA